MLQKILTLAITLRERSHNYFSSIKLFSDLAKFLDPLIKSCNKWR